MKIAWQQISKLNGFADQFEGNAHMTAVEEAFDFGTAFHASRKLTAHLAAHGFKPTRIAWNSPTSRRGQRNATGGALALGALRTP
jgi:hypothetical protein